MSLLSGLTRILLQNPAALVLELGPGAVRVWFWLVDQFLYAGDPPDRGGDIDDDEDDDPGDFWRYDAFAAVDREVARREGRL